MDTRDEIEFARAVDRTEERCIKNITTKDILKALDDLGKDLLEKIQAKALNLWIDKV